MIEKINKWLTIPTFIGVVLALVLVGGNKSTGILGAEGDTNYTSLVTDGSAPSQGYVKAKGTVYQGGVLATTTSANMTLASTDLIGYSTISMNPIVGAVTITFPASSTLSSWIPNSGDRVSIAIINATSTAVSITVAGGTGTLLRNASTSAAIISGGVGVINAVRKANSDIILYFSPAI